MAVVQSNLVAERNVRAMRVVIEEGFSKGNLDALDDVVAVETIEHQPGLGPGLAGLKGAISYLRGAFSDFTLTIEDVVADGDRVWARLQSHGIHTGPFMGVPPTGRTIGIDVIDVCRFEDGKVVEHWGVPDRLELLQQIGAWPPRRD
jgi:predicted ester cyclase